jgi:hypothetical protein
MRSTLVDMSTKTHDLLRPPQLRRRLELLDAIDAGLNVANSEERLEILRPQLERANEACYRAARAEIIYHGHSTALDRWLQEADGDPQGEALRPGLSFDWRDDIVRGILPLREPRSGDTLPSPEMTDYQPTPARHILDLVRKCALSPDDIFVDLGSGLGHVALLVTLLAGIPSLGIEVQPHHADAAQRAAQSLRLAHTQFVSGDARKADLSRGTVFYLFTPFRGSILDDVLERLKEESQTRAIRICSLGPCTRILQQQSWLTPRQAPDTGTIAVFQAGRQFKHCPGMAHLDIVTPNPERGVGIR